MQERDRPASTDPLDLLRRFVATPLKARYFIDSIAVTVQTNDFGLLPVLPLGPLENAGNQSLEWKLVRDEDSHGLLQKPIEMNAGALMIVAMGNACLAALDRDRRELLCFVGADIDARTHQEFLVPLFCRMTREACESGTDTSGGKSSDE